MPRAIPLLIVSILVAGCAGSGSPGGSSAPRTWVVTITDADGASSSHSVTRLDQEDADHDGVLDVSEYAQRTDPNDPDSDHDGMLDGHNVVLEPDSALAKEWRARGILENPRGTFLGEFDTICADGRHLNPVKASSDADSLPDGAELAGWIVQRTGVRATSDPCERDADKDGLPDDLEKQLGTDPRKADTDGDGAPDGADADPSWNLELAISNVTIHTKNGTGARIVLAAGAVTGAASNGGNATLDVDDHSPKRDSLPIAATLRAEDAAGHPVALFPDPRGAIVTFDLLKGTANDEATGHLSYRGADGDVAFDWSTVRA